MFVSRRQSPKGPLSLCYDGWLSELLVEAHNTWAGADHSQIPSGLKRCSVDRISVYYISRMENSAGLIFLIEQCLQQ